MLEAPSTPSLQQSSPETARPLVRHTRRESWGRALMLWERENKRGYQFEDGEIRVFAKPYFELLQPAKKPDPVLRHKLREQAVASGELEPVKKRKVGIGRRASAPVPNMDDQITVFESLFPDAFHGTAWTETYRSRAEGRRLKRHRDPAIAEAAERLGTEALHACIDRGDYAEVYQRMVDVVANTDLATRQQLEGFRRLKVDAELARSMVGFLHDVRSGELDAMARLRRALARQDFRKVPWTALTAPRALLHPNDHMCVRPSVLRAQARLIAPRYKPSQVPSASDYSQCLELAMAVREHLTKAGFAPRDLFDVALFMQLTLGASVKEKLLAAMVERRAALTEDDKGENETLKTALV
ncbi:MAG: hypothetical protein AAGF11_29475 [Myxococcota bacterium]